MNYDLIKSTLLEIIKEAENLDQSELEKIGDTNVYVKRGRTKEFDVNAYYYYEHENNVKIPDGLDYITEVFNDLKKEVLDENREYYDAKSYELASGVQSEVERFKVLKTSLATIDSNYEIVTKDFQNALTIGDLEERKRRLTDLNNNINTLIENKSIITKQLVEIKNTVNAQVQAMIKEQMDYFLISYRNTATGTKIAFGLDGKSILEKDKEEYDSLYALGQILNNVQDDNLVCIDDFLFVNEGQKEQVENILAKIEIFKRLKTIPKKEEPKKLPNEDIMNTITTRLREIETKRQSKRSKKVPNGMFVSAENIQEYENLLAILRILNKANNTIYKNALTDVWGMAQVAYEDVYAFKTLLNNTNLFKENTPENKVMAENQAKIEELTKYLDSIADKITNYKGTSNLPIRQTKQIGDRSWIVPEEDLTECNIIIEIMELLSKKNNNMVNVWNMGSVPVEDVVKFKNLANATNYYRKLVPSITVNEVKIEEIKNRLKALISKAQQNTGVMAKNGNVLASDAEEYNLLMAMYNYLEASKTSDNLVDYAGVKIGKEYLDKYKAIVDRLEIVRNEPQVTQDAVEEQKSEYNKEEIYKINKAYSNDLDVAINQVTNKLFDAELNGDKELKEKLMTLLQNLKDMQLYIRNAMSSTDLTKVGEVYIAKEEENKYKQAFIDYRNNRKLLPKDFLNRGPVEIVQSQEDPTVNKENALEETAEEIKEETPQRYMSEEDKKWEEALKIIREPSVPREPSKLKKTFNHLTKTSVKTLSKEAKVWFKEHRKLVVGLGLCTAVAGVSLAALPETLIYANSCNAAAMPGVSGFFNGLSTVVAALSNAKKATNGLFVNGRGEIINAGVAASKAVAATGQALVNVMGLVGSGVVAKHILKKNQEERLPEKEQARAKSKFKGFGDYLRDKFHRSKDKQEEIIPEIEEIKSDAQEIDEANKRVAQRIEDLSNSVPLEEPKPVVVENKPINIPTDEELSEILKTINAEPIPKEKIEEIFGPEENMSLGGR